jgi:hypothetical protein
MPELLEGNDLMWVPVAIFVWIKSLTQVTAGALTGLQYHNV